MSALDKSLRDLCAAHGLLNISITYHVGSHTAVSLQWEDEREQHSRGCVFGHGDTAAESLKEALVEMAKERTAELAGELVL